MNLLWWGSIGRCEKFGQNEAPVDLGTAVHKHSAHRAEGERDAQHEGIPWHMIFYLQDI